MNQAVAAVATPESLNNDELFFLVEVSFAPDSKNREVWLDHAAKFAARVEEIGGYAKVTPKTINAFAFHCPDRAVKEKLLEGVTRSYVGLLADKERLVAEERRIVSYITLVSMSAPGKTETTIAEIKSAYAAHGMEIPAAVAAKIAEREKVATERANRTAEEQARQFRKPYLHKGMSTQEKAETLRRLGYRLESRDLRGNLHFVGRDPTTAEIVKQTVFGTPAPQGTLRQHKSESAADRAHRESERDARRAARIGAQPKKGAGGSTDPHGQKSKKGQSGKK